MATPNVDAPPPRRPFPRWLVPVVVIAAGLFGFGGYRLLFLGESPRDAWDEVSATAERGDYDAVWDRVHPDTQARLLPSVRMFVDDTATIQAAGMTDAERFAFYLEFHPSVLAQYLPAEVLDVRERGSYAFIELNRPDPYRKGFAPTTTVGMKRHGGRWLVVQQADLPQP